MKIKRMGMAVSAALVLFVGSGSALAQDDESNEITVRPVEAMPCKFNEGKGWDDLSKANDAWNAWMDKRGRNDYAAIVMAPHYHSDFESVDFIWVGWWRNGNAMGVGKDIWRTEGEDIRELYAEVANCSSAGTFISRPLKMPKDDSNDESDNYFVVGFRNCSWEREGDGRWDEFMAAQNEWNAYADEHGIPGSTYVWWPGAGQPADDDYNFKYITAWDDHTMRGASWQKYIPEGHWRKRNELLGDILDCDSSRIYDSWVIRRMGDAE